MTTARDICTAAAALGMIKGQDQTLGASDMQIVFDEFKRMIDLWSNLNLMSWNLTTNTFPMTPGTASYSTTLLGSGRPLTIDSITFTLGGITYPCELISNQDYWNLTYKATTGIPALCYYDPTYPNGTFFFYPTPAAAYTVQVEVYTVIANTSTLTLDTVIATPQGYERAMVDNLAVAAMPFFGREPTPSLIKRAQESMGIVKRNNYQPLESDLGFTTDGFPPDAFIYRGF